MGDLLNVNAMRHRHQSTTRKCQMCYLCTIWSVSFDWVALSEQLINLKVEDFGLKNCDSVFNLQRFKVVFMFMN